MNDVGRGWEIEHMMRSVLSGFSVDAFDALECSNLPLEEAYCRFADYAEFTNACECLEQWKIDFDSYSLLGEEDEAREEEAKEFLLERTEVIELSSSILVKKIL